MSRINLFGREVEFDYAERWVGYSLLSLRLVMGWILLYAGVEKLLDPAWSARGFLLNAVPAGNPFAGVWPLLASDPYIGTINVLVISGFILTGLGILTGTLFRLSAFFASLMMLTFWAASLPLENAVLIDSHVVYVLLLYGLGAFGAGRLLGVDSSLEHTPLVREHPWLKYFLG